LKISPTTRRITPGIRQSYHWYALCDVVPKIDGKSPVSIIRIEPITSQISEYTSREFEHVACWYAVSLGNRRFKATKMFISERDTSAIVWLICEDPWVFFRSGKDRAPSRPYTIR